jgi:predicted ribosome quality control (RQC) complex YloA/Tae2 family protein
MRDAMQNESLRMKGDLIIQHIPDIDEGDRSITVHNYETGEEETIELDPMKTPQENAAAYYKRYKKKKSAIRHIALQIKKTEQRIEYFEQLKAQIETASIHDMYEIGEELRSKGFMKKKKKKRTIRKSTPNYMTFKTEDDIEIIVGKNNLQNEEITHSIAKGNEWFFHTAKIHGAHVLVRHKGTLDETTIRTAAQLAAWYSQARHSSSVPVDYTRIRDVKKVPGKLGSYVTYKNQKTIFIDPDEAFIRSLKQS